MGLRRALEAVPDDRLTRVTARRVVRYLHEHRLIHVDAGRICTAIGADEQRVHSVLSVLAAARVLDFVGDPPKYCFITDRVLQIETELYLRSSDSHAESLQSNVERYRRLYGGR